MRIVSRLLIRRRLRLIPAAQVDRHTDRKPAADTALAQADSLRRRLTGTRIVNRLLIRRWLRLIRLRCGMPRWRLISSLLERSGFRLIGLLRRIAGFRLISWRSAVMAHR